MLLTKEWIKKNCDTYYSGELFYSIKTEEEIKAYIKNKMCKIIETEKLEIRFIYNSNFISQEKEKIKDFKGFYITYDIGYSFYDLSKVFIENFSDEIYNFYLGIGIDTKKERYIKEYKKIYGNKKIDIDKFYEFIYKIDLEGFDKNIIAKLTCI